MSNQVVVTVPFTDLRAEAHPTAIVSFRQYADNEVNQYRALLDEARQMSYDPDMEQGFVDRKSDYASRGLNRALRLTRSLQDTSFALKTLKASNLMFTLDGEIYEQKPEVKVASPLEVFWSAVQAHINTIKAQDPTIRVDLRFGLKTYENIETSDLRYDESRVWIDLSKQDTVRILVKGEFKDTVIREGNSHLLALDVVSNIFKFYQPLRSETVLTTTPKKAPAQMTLTCPHCEDKLTVTDGTLGSCPTCWNTTKVQWSATHGWHLTGWE